MAKKKKKQQPEQRGILNKLYNVGDLREASFPGSNIDSGTEHDDRLYFQLGEGASTDLPPQMQHCFYHRILQAPIYFSWR